ncbi:hypothetical protein P7K49_002761 [Saguinus oedipus]|uniref:Uncharacterized protein n=1 Tax=Saguinus oedipus TaxID=9490 RepID=A0ABQ9WIR9_SAGOE|nr:hypothetical protein P7K49_002761 [Saguinus oedipus]
MQLPHSRGCAPDPSLGGSPPCPRRELGGAGQAQRLSLSRRGGTSIWHCRHNQAAAATRPGDGREDLRPAAGRTCAPRPSAPAGTMSGRQQEALSRDWGGALSSLALRNPAGAPIPGECASVLPSRR